MHVFVQKVTFFVAKNTKTIATRAALLTQMCTKSFVGRGFPLEELTVFRWTPAALRCLLLREGGEGKGMEEGIETKGREKEKRHRKEKREGMERDKIRIDALGEKKS